ncbi:MAG: DUF134 domain-containing protein [Bacillota bacterium]
MPRPKKQKRVCEQPRHTCFGVLNRSPEDKNRIIMLIEEYETIRLIDTLGYTQAECAQQMVAARTTIQSLYESARKKLGKAIVEGRPLKIEGGSHRYCSEDETCMRSNNCDFLLERNRNH